MNTTDKERIIDRAHWLAAQRVPFVHQGRTLKGIDCVGALAWILEYEDEIPAYPRDPVGGELERELARIMGTPIAEYTRVNRMKSLDGIQPCDILSMQYAGPIRHVGIVVPHVAIAGALSIVHTDSDVGCTTECLFDDYWMRRIMKVWRL
jgi:hypothetical protein